MPTTRVLKGHLIFCDRVTIVVIQDVDQTIPLVN